MREILFKAKRFDNRKWIEGYFAVSGITTRPFIVPKWDCTRTFIPIDPNTLCQYTEKTDKNGVKIFEGDMIRFAEWSKGEMCWIGQITYDNCIFAIIGGANKECEGDFHIQLSAIPSERIEVIGNIYEKEA